MGGDAGGAKETGGGALRTREGLLAFFLLLLSLGAPAGAFFFRRDPNIMEARNLLCARDILRGGDWLFPAIDGRTRLQKPPLPSWLSAAGSLLLGSGRAVPADGTAMRLPAFLAALAGILLVYLLSRAWGLERAGAALAAAALGTAWAYVQWAVVATWDIYAFVFGLGGVYALEKAFRGGASGKGGLGWSLLSGFFLGAAGWSKGPVAFFSVLLPYLAACLFVKETRKSFRWSRIFPSLLVGLALGSGWWILAWISHGRAAAAFGEETYAWGHRHVHSFFYYLYGLPRYTLPWTFLLLAALGAARARRKRLARASFWFLAGLALLSLVPEKKYRYALPLLFPASLLLGAWMGRGEDPFRGVPRWVQGVCLGHRALLVLGCLAGAVGVAWGVVAGSSPLFLAGGLLFFPLAWVAWKQGRDPLRLGAATAGTGALAALFLLPAISVFPRFQNRFREFSETGCSLPALPLYKMEDLNPCISWAMDPAGRLREGGKVPEGPFLVLAREEQRKRVEGILGEAGRRAEVLARPVYRTHPPEVYLVLRVPGSEGKEGEGGKERRKTGR